MYVVQYTWNSYMRKCGKVGNHAWTTTNQWGWLLSPIIRVLSPPSPLLTYPPLFSCNPTIRGGGADLGWPELPLVEVAHYRRAGGWQPWGVGGGCVCLSALKQALTAEYVWRCNKCYDELEKVWLVTRNGDDAWKKIEKNTTGTRGYIKGSTFHLTTFIYKVHALCAICCSLQLLPVIPIVFACRSTPCTITGQGGR